MKNRFGFTFKSSISIALSFSLLAQPFLAQLAQAQSGQNIFYDTNGNMTQDENGNTYEYDAENKLISFVKGDGSLKTEYTYYADGLRKSKQITLKDKSASNPIVFYYDHAKNANVVNEIQKSGSDNITSSYLMVSDTRYARYLSNDSSGAKYYVKNHKDTTMTVGANGTNPISHSYTPYGEERGLKETKAPPPDFSIASNPFLYSSQYSDIESGLQYLRARYYKADHMRFISRDSNSTPRNKYAYANGNPIMEDDPSGMIPTWASWMISGAILVASTVLTAGAGSALGVAAATAVGTVIGAGAGVGEYGLQQERSGEKFEWQGAVISGAIGGLLGGAGAGRMAADAAAARTAAKVATGNTVEAAAGNTVEAAAGNTVEAAAAPFHPRPLSMADRMSDWENPHPSVSSASPAKTNFDELTNYTRMRSEVEQLRANNTKLPPSTQPAIPQEQRVWSNNHFNPNTAGGQNANLRDTRPLDLAPGRHRLYEEWGGHTGHTYVPL